VTRASAGSQLGLSDVWSWRLIDRSSHAWLKNELSDADHVAFVTIFSVTDVLS
jgi:hypothetical protein